MMCKTAVHLLKCFGTMSRSVFFTFPLVCLRRNCLLWSHRARVYVNQQGGRLLAQEAGSSPAGLTATHGFRATSF